MNPDELRPGQRVLVNHGGARGTSGAVVVELPPWSETVAGERVEHTDEVLVQYPNTSIDGGTFFGDMREAVELSKIEVDQ